VPRGQGPVVDAVPLGRLVTVMAIAGRRAIKATSAAGVCE
jgi:hypothetical protein